MNSQTFSKLTQPGELAHQLRFASLFHPGRGVAVACDAQGEVNMNELSERLKMAYLGARAGWSRVCVSCGRAVALTAATAQVQALALPRR